MKKGISTIIAVILLLVITISLAGTAYIFIIGMLRGQMSKPISILGASCNTTNGITLVISNDGTDLITENDLTIFNGSVQLTDFDSISIPPKDSNFTSFGGGSGSNHIRVISPSNSVEITVWC